MMFFFPFIMLIMVLIFMVILAYPSQKHEPQPPLLPTDRRPYNGYTEPHSFHSPAGTSGPTPRTVSSSTIGAGPRASTSRPGLTVHPPPFAVRGPKQYSFSRDTFPGTSTEQVHRPITKTSVQNIVKPVSDAADQAPPPESLFGVRKSQQYSFSGKNLPGSSTEPVHQRTTKAPIAETVEPALDPVYQPPEHEPLFGARKPQQYSFSKNDLPRTSIEPIHRPAIVAPVQKTPTLPPGPSFSAREPRQYSYLRDDLPRSSVDQVDGSAKKSALPEPSLGTRKPQQYSFSRNDLPGPLVENVNRPAAKIPAQDIGEPCITSSFSDFLNLNNKGAVVDGSRHEDDDIKDLDHLALRKLANQEMENMKKCRTEEKLAKRCRQLIRVRDLKVQAQRHERRMQELNDRASEMVFAKNNKDLALRRIDLHGLTVKEAINHTKRALAQARELGNSEMRIIVGKGKHSKDGLAKIKPAIQTFLEENNYPVEVDPRNHGLFVVKLDSAHRGCHGADE